MPTLPRKPSAPATPAAPAAAKPDATTFVDSYGITYIGGTAQVRVAVEVKLSRNYQSCGIQAGMEFTTKADLVDDAVSNGFRKLHAALKPQIAEASTILNEV